MLCGVVARFPESNILVGKRGKREGKGVGTIYQQINPPPFPTPFPLYLKWAKYRTDIRKVRMAAACSKYMAVVNGAGGCLFGAFLGADRLPIFEYLNSATGWDNRPEAYMEIGERIQTLRQLFNIKQGIEPKNNMASPRVLGRPTLSAGANKGRTLDMEKMMADYWSQFGWDTASGEPLPKTLDRLGIG